MVVLNYNGIQWLQRCYESLEQQTIFSDLEIILTDNSSSDDSVKFTYGTENSPEDFKYPAWILAKKSDAWRSWWWAAVRNSCVNWNNWCAWKLGKLVSEPEHAGKSFYITRTFENGKRPYTEFYIFGRYNQAGWLSGTSPRFEIELMKKKGA